MSHPTACMSGVTDFAGLSNEARRVWGKTSRNGFDWLPLPQHLADSADVAERLWHHWLPDAVRRRIAAELPDGDKDGCRLVCWLTGVHDIGKATPAFACQVPSLARRMKDSGFTFDEKVTHYRRLAPHALAGHVILRDWLSQQDGWTEDQAAQFAVVVGSHHGVPPSHSEINQLLANPYLIGDGVWERVRNELLDWMADRTGVRDRLADWRHVTLSQPVQVLLSAIVIVADWIASNQDLFPCGIRDEEAMDRLEQAWELLELPRPWRPVDTSTLPCRRCSHPLCPASRGRALSGAGRGRRSSAADAHPRDVDRRGADGGGQNRGRAGGGRNPRRAYGRGRLLHRPADPGDQ